MQANLQLLSLDTLLKLLSEKQRILDRSNHSLSNPSVIDDNVKEVEKIQLAIAYKKENP